MAYPRTSFEALHQEAGDYALLRERRESAPARPSQWTVVAAALAGRRAALQAWAARCPHRANTPRNTAPLYPRTR